MRSFQFLLLIIIIFLSPIDKFFLSIGFRVNYFEVFVLLFILISLGKLLAGSTFKRPDTPILTYVKIEWGWLVVILLSSASFIYLDKSATELSFYLKGFFQSFVYVVFFTFMFLYVNTLSLKQINTLLNVFIYIMVISAFYGIMQLVYMFYFDVDLDSVISSSLPLGGKEILFSDLSVGNFFRLNGLSGDPSVYASFCIPVLTVLFHFIFFQKKYFYLIHFNIILISFILTMSGSGVTGFSVTLLIIMIFNISRINRKTILISALLLIPAVILFFAFSEDVLYFFGKKFESGGTTTDHLDVAMKSIAIGLQYPVFGVGFNNFAYIYEAYYRFTGFNSHNSFISYFVETGFLGLLYRVITAGMIALMIFMKRTRFGYMVLACFIGSNIAALGYETLNLFFNQLIMAILFVALQKGFPGDTKKLQTTST